MLLRRIYDDKLAQASYLIGCSATGEALVVDPNRDIDQYLEAARAESLGITHVTETHIHADFASGSRELAARAGARLYLSAEGGPDWQYGFAGEAGAVLVRDGHSFKVGNIRIDVLHTPGHTPEHLAFVVTDTAGADEPMGVVTGDFVFVGDVGRPDLLEKAARVAGTMEQAARQLFHSLTRFRALPDWLQLWPGHGAGSACGKALGAVPQSTLGYEKRFNWAFGIQDEDEFVRAVLAGQPEPPRYFAEMKRMNRDGARLLGGLKRPPRRADELLPELLRAGACVVDTRPALEHAAGHVPGTVSIPLDRSFTTWAGWLLPYDADFFLIADDERPETLDEAVRDLALIGLDRVAGYFGTDVVRAWAGAGGRLERIPELTPTDLAERLERGEVAVVDVRGRSEWDAGHLPGVPNIPLGYLAERAEELPAGRPIVLHCQSGARSHIGASLLQTRGFRQVANLKGGFGAWQKEGHPVQHPQEVPV